MLSVYYYCHRVVVHVFIIHVFAGHGIVLCVFQMRVHSYVRVFFTRAHTSINIETAC